MYQVRTRGGAIIRAAVVAGLLLLVSAILGAQEPFDIRAKYGKSEHMVPMRDGKKLFTTVYAPKDKSETYPIMLFRTPYGTGPHGPDRYRQILGPSMPYAREGFIFVYQDVRGKGPSEGEFVVMRPVVPKPSDASEVDESSDTYDTISWVLDKVKGHNGRVGQWGVSYPGFQTAMGMIRAHPALVASSPQASPADMFIGDDFHHNGAFRLMYTFSWLKNHAQTRSAGGGRPGRFSYGTDDGYKFFLEIGPIKNINERFFQRRVPTWNEYMEHGTYDAYWQKQNFLPYLRGIGHAILNVAGWFDAEDFYGPMIIYRTIEEQNKENKSTLVVGPWQHGGWARGSGDSLGDISFGSRTSEYYRDKVEFPFFKYHLKGKGEFELPEVVAFETGSNQWRHHDQWPPKETRTAKLYFQAGGKLGFDPPGNGQGDEASDSYVSDPANPMPFSAEPRTTQGHTWMIEDQRFAAKRPDVLVYQTEVLDSDITIAGPIIADLFVSTTGTDSDWIVKLIDVFPDQSPEGEIRGRKVRMAGFQMLLAGEVMRGKFRKSLSKPEPMVPGEVTEVAFDLRDRYHRFKQGHRIMVQVQSSWFPVIDRNPQQFVDIYEADASTFQKATQRVYRSGSSPSHIKLGLLSGEGR